MKPTSSGPHLALASSLCALVLSACASGPETRFYETTKGGAAQLRDGMIRVTTLHVIPPDENTIVQRELRAEGGKLEVVTRTADERASSYPLSEKVWKAEWRKLLDAKLFQASSGLDVRTRDPAIGASYHVVEAQLGERRASFSSQYYANLFGVLTSGDVQRRLDLVNGIVRAVREAREASSEDG